MAPLVPLLHPSHTNIIVDCSRQTPTPVALPTIFPWFFWLAKSAHYRIVVRPTARTVIMEVRSAARLLSTAWLVGYSTTLLPVGFAVPCIQTPSYSFGQKQLALGFRQACTSSRFLCRSSQNITPLHRLTASKLTHSSLVRRAKAWLICSESLSSPPLHGAPYSPDTTRLA